MKRRYLFSPTFLGVGVTAWACSSEPAKSAVDAEALRRAEAGVSDTRCEFRDREDRVPVLTEGPGALAPNIRRVYAVGNERDGERVLRCREADTNLDGTKDWVRAYNEGGEPLFEEADANYDGVFDTWIEFSGGVVIRAQFDRNGDGKPDEFRVYSDGQLARVQRDTTHDGQLDTWEVYERGQLRRIGRDTNGDERVDEWYRDDTKKPEAANNDDTKPEAANSANPKPEDVDSENEVDPQGKKPKFPDSKVDAEKPETTSPEPLKKKPEGKSETPPPKQDQKPRVTESAKDR